jgi:AbrB family looped-hinge helix DNA binding protein
MDLSIGHLLYTWLIDVKGLIMETVTLSPKFQVVIPKATRESLNLIAGQKVKVIVYENRIELIPVRSMKKMRGFLKGIDTSVPREDDRV